MGSRPLRLALERDGRPLIAERHHPDRGSLALLDASGWRPAGEIIALRSEPVAEARRGHGDVPVKVPAAAGVRGGVRIVIEAACEGREPVTLEARLLPDPEELHLALSVPARDVLALRSDWVAQPGEARLVLALEPPGGNPAKVLFSSLGYGLLVEAGGDPEVGAAPREDAVSVFAPDPDTFRISVRGRSLRCRLAPGAPEEALRRLAPPAPAPVEPSRWLWVEVPGAASLPSSPSSTRGASAAAAPGAGALLAPLFVRAALAPPLELTSGDPRLAGGVLSPASWEDLERCVGRALEGALAGSPRPFVIPIEGSGLAGGEPGELWLRAAAAAAFLPRLVLPADLAKACLGGLDASGRAPPGAASARRYLLARAAAAAALPGAGAGDGSWGRMLFAARPLEPGAWDEGEEWLVGSSLLVAPVLAAGKRGREVYFPEGRWIDVRDLGERADRPAARAGPRREAVEIPPGEVGLFVREGEDQGLGRALWKALHGSLSR